MITVTCDNCDKIFEVDDDAQPGDKISCPYCNDVNRLPGIPKPAKPASHVAAAKLPQNQSKTASLPTADDPETEILIVRQGMFRTHPLWYSAMVLLGVAGLVISVFSLGTAPIGGGVLLLPGLIAMVVAILWWVIWWAAPHRWVRLTITNKRTIRSEGIVMKKTSEVLHRHVTNVTIEQGLMDRIFGVGYIGIDSAGQGGEPDGEGDSPHRRSQIEIEVDGIPDPYKIKAIIDKYR